MIDLPLPFLERGTFCIKVFWFCFFGISIIHDLLYKDCLIASRLKDLFLYCCVKNTGSFVWWLLLVSRGWRMIWSGNIFLVLEEHDVETYDLGSFNSTYNRNGKSFRILKLRKRERFSLFWVWHLHHIIW